MTIERRPSLRGRARKLDTGHRASKRAFKANQRKQAKLSRRARST